MGRMWIGLAFAGCAALGSGCGQSHLAPADACATLIESGMRCGTYRVGAFGGASPDDDVARCTSGIELLNENCQQRFAEAAMCTTRDCADLAPCQALVDRFQMECSGSP